MFCNFDRKIAYLAMPRTASHSTSYILVKNHGFKKEMSYHHRGWDPDKPRGDWIIMTTVRNHFDWWTSFINYVRGDYNGEMWDAPSAYPQYFPQDDRLFGLHEDAATDIIRYESIDWDISRVLKQIFDTHRQMQFRGQRSTYQEYLTLDEREWIEHQYKYEMEELEYEWEEADG